MIIIKFLYVWLQVPNRERSASGGRQQRWRAGHRPCWRRRHGELIIGCHGNARCVRYMFSFCTDIYIAAGSV